MAKTTIKIILSIVLAGIIAYGILFISLFIVPVVFDENDTVDLQEIDEADRESIIQLMNLEEIKDDINLIKLEEISAQDIYYKIYFNSDIEDLSNYSKSDEIYVLSESVVVGTLSSSTVLGSITKLLLAKTVLKDKIKSISKRQKIVFLKKLVFKKIPP